MKDRLRAYLKNTARQKGRTISVGLIGYGTTSEAMLEVLSQADAVGEITVRHNRKMHNVPPDAVRLICGEGAFRDIYEDLLFTSPSVRREALKMPSGTELTSDTDIFFSERRKNTFLVSGSDGKSTVTTITSLLLSPTFPTLFTGGNLGRPVALASLNSEAFLLELSSFNLRYTEPKAKRSLLTNVTPNHLDWHSDLDEYEECKARLIRAADEPILPLSCPFNESLARDTDSFALVSDTLTDRELRKLYKTLHTVTVKGGYIAIDDVPILKVERIKRSEKHNVQNFMSATALTIGYTDKYRIREVAESFSGLEHRCESFTLLGKEYINSSIDTTPERTRATITSLARPVHLILGGRGKGLSYDAMRAPILEYARSISVYGDAADEITEWLEGDSELAHIPYRCFATFLEATDHADASASPCGTVLLSPAATAYGEFKSFAERGELFKSYLTKKHSNI